MTTALLVRQRSGSSAMTCTSSQAGTRTVGRCYPKPSDSRNLTATYTCKGRYVSAIEVGGTFSRVVDDRLGEVGHVRYR
jgi:hypothetical protein